MHRQAVVFKHIMAVAELGTNGMCAPERILLYVQFDPDRSADESKHKALSEVGHLPELRQWQHCLRC